MDNPYQKAEAEYFRLRSLLSAGTLSPEQFDSLVMRLQVRDNQGTLWTLDKNTGRWVSNKQPAPPSQYQSPPQQQAQSQSQPIPPQPQYIQPLVVQVTTPQPVQPQPVQRQYVQPAPKKGLSCGKLLGCGCLGTLIALVVLGVGGFLAYKSGFLTIDRVMALVGMGPGNVEINNFREEMVYVSIYDLKSSQDGPFLSWSQRLNAYDILAHQITNPGSYRIDFGLTDGGADLGSCTLTLKSGDQYQFIPMPDKIVINRVNKPASNGEDFLVRSSSLCR
jgi:hypothetical protein